ncbi:hypothetical protein J3459_022503 [Metarhizium acridum]|nr:hypothetical protein J3459_022503 [Metarhizium acridum]
MASVAHQEVSGRNDEGCAPSLVAYESDTDYSCDSFDSDVVLSSMEAWNEARIANSVNAQPTHPSTHEQGQVKPPQIAQDFSARGGERIDNTEPNLCQEQQDLIDLIASGRNVFFTGSAGCGKSTVLKAAVRKLQDMGRTVHVVAPTGRAALQVNGATTWTYMGWTPDNLRLSKNKLIDLVFRKHVRKRLKNTDVLIIDEISMVENHHLERINISMKAARRWGEDAAPPFGGVQVIVTGDFCQLPPVKPFEHCIFCGQKTEANDYETEFDCPKNHGPFKEREKWAFMSEAWEECKFVYVELKQIHRQKDQDFLKMLRKCRLGISFSREETEILMNHPCHVTNATRLFSTKEEVARTNTDNFRKLQTPIVKYQSLDEFNWCQDTHPYLKHYNNRSPDGSLVQLKEHRLERQVQLRIGMIVVLQVNLDLRAGLCNGSQGIICGFEDYDPAKLPRAKSSTRSSSAAESATIYGDYASLKERQVERFMAGQEMKIWPRVLFHNGQKRTIYAECTVNSFGHKEPYSLLHRTQIPLMAAWAMSIHKSQGMTLDRVIVDVSKAFEEGQVYVALSRATGLHGLKIQGSQEGLSVGRGGNADVQRFLREKFGSGSGLPSLYP